MSPDESMLGNADNILGLNDLVEKLQQGSYSAFTDLPGYPAEVAKLQASEEFLIQVQGFKDFSRGHEKPMREIPSSNQKLS